MQPSTRMAAILACVLSLRGLHALPQQPRDIDTRVDIGGYALHLTCQGNGSPTVVLASGLEASARTWQRVVPEVQKLTRVCSYDRAYVGSSDPAPREVRRIGDRTFIELRSGQDLVQDLRKLLLKAAEPSPYVLVGHSFGGSAAMLYAHHYPGDVVGMVLVDSTHPEQTRRLGAFMTATEAKLARDGFIQNREGFDIERILGEVGATRWRTNIPLVVLAAGRPDPNPTTRSTQEAKVWRDLQIDLSQRSPNGKLIVAEKSGHNIQVDQPELVTEAIRDVVAATRARVR